MEATRGYHGYHFIRILPTFTCLLPALLTSGTYTLCKYCLIDKLRIALIISGYKGAPE